MTTVSPAVVITERSNGLVRITLNRPKQRNALNTEMVEQLVRAIEIQPGDRLLLLRGSGGNFCAGGDVREMQAALGARSDENNDPLVKLNATFGHLARSIAKIPVPVIAMVDGAVMGGGFGLACVADIVIAAKSVQFKLPETSLGLIPAQIAPFLAQRIGAAQALQLALTGASIDADRALQLGLVHHIDSEAEFAKPVPSAVRQVLANGPAATRQTKELIDRPHVSAETVDAAARAFARAARSEEAAEGLAAFMNKRSPNWPKSPQ